MKRKTKKGSGMYAFLEKEGLLDSTDELIIKAAKKRYYAICKREWINAKKKESKSFEIFFTLDEFKTISSRAKKYHTSSTNYIKISALANKLVIDPVFVGVIRELIIMHHNTLLLLVEEKTLPMQIAVPLITQILQIEKTAMNFFSSLK